MYEIKKEIGLSMDCAEDRERVLTEAERGLKNMNLFGDDTNPLRNYSKTGRTTLGTKCPDGITGCD